MRNVLDSPVNNVDKLNERVNSVNKMFTALDIKLDMYDFYNTKCADLAEFYENSQYSNYSVESIKAQLFIDDSTYEALLYAKEIQDAKEYQDKHSKEA